MYYATQGLRGGNIKGEILKHAIHKEVLALAGDQRTMPKNQGQNITYRRYLPPGATTASPLHNNQNRPVVTVRDHIVNEGVTPRDRRLTSVDIPAQIDQYGVVYSYTDKTADLFEDDIPKQEMIRVGEEMGLLREMIRWGVLRTCTNKFFSGGTTRATVDKGISLNQLRKVARNLASNRAKMIGRMTKPSALYGTSPVEDSYLVFTHTDQEANIRNLPGFIHKSLYSSGRKVHRCEIGTCEGFRFLLSPELAPYAAGGASVAGTGLEGTANVDVYPLIVCGQDAWASLMLRGMSSWNTIHLPHSQITKSDLLGQRGYVGAIFWDGAFIQNDGWMAVVESGVSTLDD